MKNILMFFSCSLFMEGVFGESFLVMEGDSVTLHTGLTEIKQNDVIDWRFKSKLLGRVDREANISETHDDVLDGKFNNRLKLDHQTADLTIRDIRTTDSGDYEIKINTKAVKTFKVTVEQYGVDERQLVSVMLGDSVTLQTDAVDIQRYNMIWWKFEHENSPVANINRTTGKVCTSDGADGRFRHRLQLDYLTGSLTIKNTGTKHSGIYEADISSSSSKHTIHRLFNVTVSGEINSESVKEGESVTLQTNTEIQIYDFILWMSQDIVIAEIHKAAQRYFIYDADERFRGRLQLNNQTGSLNITDVRTTDSGIYELKISSSRHTIHKKIIVTVIGELQSVSGQEGYSITLPTNLTKIQRDDQILWMFKDTPVAELFKRDQQAYIHDFADERFRGRLQLDNHNGSLTIMNIRTTDSGLYEVKIKSSRHFTHKRFTVAVIGSGLSSGHKAGIVVAVLLISAVAAAAYVIYRRKISTLKRQQVEALSVRAGDSVTLKTDADIQSDEQIQWLFGDQQTCIAKIDKGKLFTFDGPDGNSNRLELHNQTGSLTIRNITTQDNGFYKMQITRSAKKKTFKIFSVTVSDNAGINNPEEMLLTSIDTSNSRL